MRNVWTIARREYRLYFTSPIAYIAALVTLLTVGIYFVVIIYYTVNNSYYSNTAPGIDIVIGPLATIFLFAAPAVTMRLLADEQRMGTLELLLTTPIKDGELVIGKWLGAFLFMLSIIAITLVYPLVLNKLTTPGIDQGVMIAGYLAIILLTAVYLAIGTAMSSFFSNQFAAFFATLAVLILFWWLIRLPTFIIQNNSITSILNYLDLNGRFNSMLGGTISISDIVYPLSLTVLGLFLGTTAVEIRRWK
jgi:ABC-2 type transport system permease protein